MNTTINIELLEPNTGQIAGLKRNPRKWDERDLKRLVNSIKDTPELLQARGLIVYKHRDKYVILGGNMRYEACKRIGMTDIPCYALKDDLPLKTLQAIVIKDNSSFGEWAWEELANEWDEDILIDSGVLKMKPPKEVSIDVVGEVEFSDDEKMVLKIKMSESEHERVSNALSKHGTSKEQALLKVLGL